MAAITVEETLEITLPEGVKKWVIWASGMVSHRNNLNTKLYIGGGGKKLTTAVSDGLLIVQKSWKHQNQETVSATTNLKVFFLLKELCRDKDDEVKLSLSEGSIHLFSNDIEVTAKTAAKWPRYSHFVNAREQEKLYIDAAELLGILNKFKKKPGGKLICMDVDGYKLKFSGEGGEFESEINLEKSSVFKKAVKINPLLKFFQKNKAGECLLDYCDYFFRFEIGDSLFICNAFEIRE